MTIDPTSGLRGHADLAARSVARMSDAEVAEPADGNELVAEDAAHVCGRCDRRITAGQPMRRRASGGWAHETC